MELELTHLGCGEGLGAPAVRAKTPGPLLQGSGAPGAVPASGHIPVFSSPEVSAHRLPTILSASLTPNSAAAAS